MIDKEKTFAVLIVLQRARAEMIQDFLDHNPDIFTPSFKYEASPTLLGLAREKYFMTWLSNHWKLFSQESIRFVDKQKEMEKFFASIFLKLLSKSSIIKTDHAEQLNLGIQLIEDIKKTLNGFIKVGDNSDIMRNRLELEIEKNRVLFEREIKKLSEQEK
jgi:hypothetical protein